jgi:hypothetical protein
VNDAADNPAVVYPLDTSHIGGQAKFNPIPLLVP